MAALTARDTERVLHFLAAAEEVGGDDPFTTPQVLREIAQLVGADWVGYFEGGREAEWPLDCEWDLPVCFEDVADEHPFPAVRRRGDVRAVKLSDFLTRRQLHRSRLYAAWLAPGGIEHQLSVAIRSSPRRMNTFVFDRPPGRDFTERERLVLDLLQPHLERLWRAAGTRRRLKAALAAVDREDENEPRGVIVLGPAGELEVVSPAARRLVRDHFGMQCESELPPALRQWLGSGAPTLRRRRLTVERSMDMLLLEEVPNGLGLTAREREILALVARGKTNPEIAALLWIAPTTVRKHLENVYAKLGVRTRTAAAARFLREERGS